jgi:hypothetical protein
MNFIPRNVLAAKPYLVVDIVHMAKVIAIIKQRGQ